MPPASERPIKKKGTTAHAERPVHKSAISSLILRSFAAGVFWLASSEGLLGFGLLSVFIVQHKRRLRGRPLSTLGDHNEFSSLDSLCIQVDSKVCQSCAVLLAGR